MREVRKSEFGHAGQIAPRIAIANSLRPSHTEKSDFLPTRSAFFLKPACCLRNCDRGKKSSFSTVSAKSRHRFPSTYMDMRWAHSSFIYAAKQRYKIDYLEAGKAEAIDEANTLPPPITRLCGYGPPTLKEMLQSNRDHREAKILWVTIAKYLERPASTPMGVGNKFCSI